MSSVLARMVLIAWALLAPLQVQAQAKAGPPDPTLDWRRITFDREGELGGLLAVTRDARDRPHAVYFDRTRSPRQLVHARFDGQAWLREVVASTNTEADQNWPGLAIAIDSDGRIYIAWYEAGGLGSADDCVRLAERNGTSTGSWTLTAPACSGVGRSVSLALVQDRPRLALQDTVLRRARYMERDANGTWSTDPFVTADNSAAWLQLLPTSDGRPRIIYTGGSPSFDLRVAERLANGNWDDRPIAGGNIGGEIHVARGAGNSFVVGFSRSTQNGSSHAVLSRIADNGVPNEEIIGIATPGSGAATLAVDYTPEGMVQALRVVYSGATPEYRHATWAPDGVPVLAPFESAALRMGPAAIFESQPGQPQIVHADAEYGDIRHLRFAPAWNAGDAGGLGSGSTVDGIAGWRNARGQVELLFGSGSQLGHAVWTGIGYSSTPLGGNGGASQISVALAPDGTQVAVLRQASVDQLQITSRAPGGNWSAPADYAAGRDPHVFFAPDATRVVLWHDVAAGRIRANISGPAMAPLALVHDAIAPLGADSGNLAAAMQATRHASDSGYFIRVAATYHRASDASLRTVSLIRASDGSWSFDDSLAAQFNGVVEGERSAIAFDTDGGLNVVHTRRQGPVTRLALNGSQRNDVNIAGTVSELHLEMRNGRPQDYRIVFVQSGGAQSRLRYLRASASDTLVEEDFGTLPLAAATPSRRVSLQAGFGEFMAWRDDFLGQPRNVLALRNDERTGSAGEYVSLPRLIDDSEPINAAEEFLRLITCSCGHDDITLGRIQGKTATLPNIALACLLIAASGPLPDTCGGIACGLGGDRDSRSASKSLTAGLAPRLRQHFAQTAAGQYYLDLFQAHGAEIIAMTMRNPDLMWDRVRTFENFAPGLTAMVDGNGADYRITDAMILQARNVWLQWAENGSPELRAVIESELARTSNLNPFRNMTFDQWFNALSVGPNVAALFRDGFEE